jgi:hypothetical protein
MSHPPPAQHPQGRAGEEDRYPQHPPTHHSWHRARGAAGKSIDRGAVVVEVSVAVVSEAVAVGVALGGILDQDAVIRGIGEAVGVQVASLGAERERKGQCEDHEQSRADDSEGRLHRDLSWPAPNR